MIYNFREEDGKEAGFGELNQFIVKRNYVKWLSVLAYCGELSIVEQCAVYKTLRNELIWNSQVESRNFSQNIYKKAIILADQNNACTTYNTVIMQYTHIISNFSNTITITK